MPRYMVQMLITPDDYIKALGEGDQRAEDFLPDVFWGNMLNKSYGWAIVDAESEDQVRDMLPEAVRDKADVCRVRTYSPELVQAIQSGDIEHAA